MRGTPISKLLPNLGFQPGTRPYDTARDHIRLFFFEHLVAIKTASDGQIKNTAYEYLHNASGPPRWVTQPPMVRVWTDARDRLMIEETVFNIMKQQQNNVIDAWHRRNREAECTECRYHVPDATLTKRLEMPVRAVESSSLPFPSQTSVGSADVASIASDVQTLPPKRARKRAWKVLG